MGRLFGRGKTSETSSVSAEALQLVSEALEDIEATVRVPEYGVAEGAVGRSAAAEKLQQAHELDPEDPLLHYAYACALALGAQFESAENERKACAEAHPEFRLAQFELPVWSPLAYPLWGPKVSSVPPLISKTVTTAILLPTRDGIQPRATLFFRDAEGVFSDPAALRAAPIEIATVISSVVHDPQVVAIYYRINDDPSAPFDGEVPDVPFAPRGTWSRRAYEYLCIQDDLDFAVIDARDQILLNKRIEMSRQMKETNRELLGLLDSSEGREVPPQEFHDAVVRHQQQFSPADVWN